PCPFIHTSSSSSFSHSSRTHRDLHSFPTRRSSDLRKRCPGEDRGRRGHSGSDQPPLFHQSMCPIGHCAGRGAGVRRWHVLLSPGDRKSTRLNSSHVSISYAVFCLKKKKTKTQMDDD